MSKNIDKIRQMPFLGEAIMNAAWRHIEASCAASLSLEGLADSLSLPLETLTGCFADRNALMTELYIDSYTRFADSTLRAWELFPGPENVLRKLTGVGISYREWAMANRTRYQLMFGPPLPGYELEVRRLRPAMMRAFSVLYEVVRELYKVRKLNVRSIPLLDTSCGDRFFLNLDGVSEEDHLIYSVAIILWGRIHGLVSLELSQAVPPFSGNSDVLYL